MSLTQPIELVPREDPALTSEALSASREKRVATASESHERVEAIQIVLVDPDGTKTLGPLITLGWPGVEATEPSPSLGKPWIDTNLDDDG
jgi:hypothetical protein